MPSPLPTSPVLKPFQPGSVPSSGISIASPSRRYSSTSFSPVSSPGNALNVGSFVDMDSIEGQLAPFVPAPVTGAINDGADKKFALLELKDGTCVKGYSFGANESISGEFVFQTGISCFLASIVSLACAKFSFLLSGMVGYPETLTDPSYQGQILVCTFPLMGNYGVPSRDTEDPLLPGIPLHFESKKIHVAGLVVGDYTEDFSHYLATSSLGSWLKEQGIPAIYGVDTRALTKTIREKGSMLGKLLMAKDGVTPIAGGDWRAEFESVEWEDPNVKNLVAEGKYLLLDLFLDQDQDLTFISFL